MATTRRDFLAAAAATSGAMLTGCASTATETGTGGYNRVIDAHAHWYPQEFVTLMEKEGPANGAKMGRSPKAIPWSSQWRAAPRPRSCAAT